MISIDGMWDDPADNEANVAWVRSAWEEVKEFGTGGVYLNFTGLADEELDGRRRQRAGTQPPPARRDQGQVRPGELLPGEQQHPAGQVIAERRPVLKGRPPRTPRRGR